MLQVAPLLLYSTLSKPYLMNPNIRCVLSETRSLKKHIFHLGELIYSLSVRPIHAGRCESYDKANMHPDANRPTVSPLELG